MMNAVIKASVSNNNWADFSDEELVCEYRALGDYRCFDELVNRYRSVVLRYLKSRYNLRSEQLDELAQATFARAWQKLDTFDVSRRFRPWICRIAMTQACDYLREVKRTSAVLSLDSAYGDEEERGSMASEIESRELEPSERIEKRDTERAVRRAMAKLPEQFRQVLELVFFQGLTRQRVADVLDLHISTVSRRVSSALEQLRVYLFTGKSGERYERIECILPYVEKA